MATGMSQEAFADRCGFARSYMSRVERGRANPSVDALQTLADALGVAMKDLFTDQPAEVGNYDSAASMLVPVASDGTPFGPYLRRAGQFTVGDKGDEVTFEEYEEALAYLRRMGLARWRRPNTNGNWGIVSAVRWVEDIRPKR